MSAVNGNQLLFAETIVYSSFIDFYHDALDQEVENNKKPIDYFSFLFDKNPYPQCDPSRITIFNAEQWKLNPIKQLAVCMRSKRLKLRF